MKVAILGIQNIKHMTLISLYTDYFEKRGIDYDVIYIDKYGIDEDIGAKNIYKLNTTKKIYSSVIGKAIKTINFISYAKKILSRNKYDFVVVWREQTAAMFATYLRKNYKGMYSVNIRDLWNKNNFFITKAVGKAVNNSYFNTVSSEGFISEIPRASYLMVHSVNDSLVKNPCLNVVWKEKEPIVVTYIGTVRFYDYLFELISILANDQRFELRFIGQGSDVILNYVNQNKINNVKCVGAFKPEDTMKLLTGTHIINCAFGAHNDAEKRLIPIRYYYALYTNCMVLTTEGTWLSKEAQKTGIGINVPGEFNCECDLPNYIFETYKNNYKKIGIGIDAYKKEILQSHKLLEEKLDTFFENELRKNV